MLFRQFFSARKILIFSLPFFAYADSTPSMNIEQVFSSAPLIYSFLLLMSITALGIWLYSLLSFRSKQILNPQMIKELQELLVKQEFDTALNYCKTKPTILSQMIARAIQTKEHGPEFMIDTMKEEGKRLTTGSWQRISLLNDIVLIAPMLGLLGTVIGMFYAFYDINRSVASITALFDGLGIAVGTTVAGLVVAIVAMFFSSTLKYRLIKKLSNVEDTALHLSQSLQKKKH